MTTKRDDLHEEIPGLRGLADVAPPPSLAPAIMRAIATPETGFGPWVRRLFRFELRLTPLTAGVLGAALAAGGFALGTGRAPAPRPIALDVPQTAAAADVVLVRFVLVAKGAKKVAVAGDFNGWSAEALALDDPSGGGVFVATVPLPRGAHEYMFVVDGVWVTDPAAAERRPDGFGRDNAVLRL